MADQINHLNVTVEVGAPTSTYHLLQGKYKRFIAEEHRVSVENWYNNYSTAQQRAKFKTVVRAVMLPENRTVMKKADEENMLKARVIMKKHGGEHVAKEYRKLVALWLAMSGETERQMFREIFGKIKPLRLFNGISDYKTTYTVEGIHNTAEHIHLRNIGVANKSMGVKKKSSKGQPTPKASLVSSSLPHVVEDSDVGSRAMASTTCGRPVVKPKTLQSANNKGTTYDAFFGSAKPIPNVASPRVFSSRGTGCRAPWGNLLDGHLKGTMMSQTAASYQPTVNFQNYNNNYAGMLAKRCHEAAEKVRETEAEPVPTPPASSYVSASTAGRKKQRPATAHTARSAV